MFLEWKDFVTRPWTMERVFLDLNVTEEEKEDPNSCQEHFLYRDIISCLQRPYPFGYFSKTRYSEHQPFYEMRNDGSGKPYNNVLELRAAKIRNFLETKNYAGVNEHWTVQYEELLEHGTNSIIKKLEQLTGATSVCKPSPPQQRKRRVIDQDMFVHLDQHLDWEAENMVGYYRRVSNADDGNDAT